MDRKRLRAVIWDMDGVLLDSEEVHFNSWRAVFNKYGLIFKERALNEIFGMTSIEVVRLIGGEDLSDDFIAQLIEEKDYLFGKWIKNEAKFLPGAREWLERFQSKGIPQALASSSGMDSIEVILDALKARHYFKVILSGRDLPSKPAPHLFLLAASQLRVSPEDCLVIEDAIVGVRAAKAAGMTCLAVTTTNHAGALQEADYVYESLADLQDDFIHLLFS